jgi:hypothetical protein
MTRVETQDVASAVASAVPDSGVPFVTGHAQTVTESRCAERSEV